MKFRAATAIGLVLALAIPTAVLSQQRNNGGSSGSGSSVSVTAGTPNIVITPSPGTSAFTVGGTTAQNTPSDAGSHSYTVLSSDITKEILLANTFTALVVPQATGSFGAGASFGVVTTSAVTATSTTSTINGIAGATGILLAANQYSQWDSDGTNWRVTLGAPQPATQTGTTFLRDDMTWHVPGGGGSGTVSSGVANSFAYYAGAGTTVGSYPNLDTQTAATILMHGATTANTPMRIRVNGGWTDTSNFSGWNLFVNGTGNVTEGIDYNGAYAAGTYSIGGYATTLTLQSNNIAAMAFDSSQNATLAAHLTFTAPATSGTIAGSLCATSGGLVLYESGATGCTISLRALKKNILDMPSDRAVDELMQLKPVSFAFKDTGTKRFGLVAEDVEAIDPRLSTYDGEGKLQAYDPNGILALLVATVQHQQVEINHLRSRLK